MDSNAIQNASFTRLVDKYVNFIIIILLKHPDRQTDIHFKDRAYITLMIYIIRLYVCLAVCLSLCIHACLSGVYQFLRPFSYCTN